MNNKGKHTNSYLKKQWTPTIKKIVINGTKAYKYMLTGVQYKTLVEWMTESITQDNIAKKYGVHQTSIHKTLFGNITYPSKKRYGGIFNKINKFHTGNYLLGKGKYLKKM